MSGDDATSPASRAPAFCGLCQGTEVLTMLAGGCNWLRACPQCVDPGAQWQKQAKPASLWLRLFRDHWPAREDVADWLLVVGLLLIGGALGFVLGAGP